jgi:hypothetical protein
MPRGVLAGRCVLTLVGALLYCLHPVAVVHLVVLLSCCCAATGRVQGTVEAIVRVSEVARRETASVLDAEAAAGECTEQF